MVHVLLDLNCDAIIRDEHGASAEDYAVRFGFLEVPPVSNSSLLLPLDLPSNFHGFAGAEILAYAHRTRERRRWEAHLLGQVRASIK